MFWFLLGMVTGCFITGGICFLRACFKKAEDQENNHLQVLQKVDTALQGADKRLTALEDLLAESKDTAHRE